ncbi:MAG: hypothetical protein ACI9WU_003146 [Myxococcota bacterium]|jgi:hypothetical protein
MNITHFYYSAIDSCSGYKKPLTPDNECLAVKLALAVQWVSSVFKGLRPGQRLHWRR